MDVSFFEGTSYYTESHLQGGHGSEDGFLDTSDLFFKIPNTPLESYEPEDENSGTK